MPRPRSSAFAVGSSSSSSSSHAAHESRGSMQAQASDAQDSAPPRTSRVRFAGLPETVGDDEESQSSKASTQASITGYSGSIYGSGIRVSKQSEASLSNYSLDPRNSIGNRNSGIYTGSRISSNNQHAHIAFAPDSSNNHSVPTMDEYYEPTTAPNQGQVARASRTIDPQDLLDFYSEEPRAGNSSDSRLDAWDADYIGPLPWNHIDRFSRSGYDRGYDESDGEEDADD